MGDLSTVAAAARVEPMTPQLLGERVVGPSTHHCPFCGGSWTEAPDLARPTDEERAELAEVWQRTLARIHGEVTDFILHVWFRPLELVRVDRAPPAPLAVVAAPPHVRGWVRERYGEILRVALSAELGLGVAVLLTEGGHAAPVPLAVGERPQATQPARPDPGPEAGPTPETAAQPSIKRRRSDLPA